MQLRVARLCLDCEELHVSDSCPICASERYAFLSKWLPSEERRRWRRPPQTAASSATPARRTFGRLVARLLGRPEPVPVPTHPRTRASDFVPKMDFEPPASDPAPKPPVLDARPASRQGR